MAETTFMTEGIVCKILLLGKFYQASAKLKGRIFAELFDVDKNSIQDVIRKFKILLNASRKLLRKRKQVLCKIWETQGIHKEIPNF